MATPSYYAWGAGRMPTSVLLHADVMHGINHGIAAAIAANPGRARESGGILLGSIDSVTEAHPVVRIERFDPIESEYRRGASFVLTDRDQRALAKRLAWWNSRRNGNLRPVGFYRSHTRRGLYVDNDDFALIQACFPERDAVFLLVRPERAPSNMGGFFYWEEGDMHRESSYQEFPFDPVRVPLISPAPAIVPPVPVRAATMSSQRWLRAAIPLAAVLVLCLTFYTARTLTMAREPVPMSHAATRPLLPGPAAASMDKPSPLKPKQAARTLVPLPLRNSPAGVVDASLIVSRAVVSLQPEIAPPTAASITTPATPSVLASINAPPSTALPRRHAPLALVTVEPVGESKLGRFVGKIPGLRRLEKTKHGFIPARPIREVAPSVPASRELAHDVPVDLKVTVDPAGNVAGVEPTNRGADRQLVRLAADAARNWQFEPARRNEETVSSELILHFTFKPPNQAE